MGSIRRISTTTMRSIYRLTGLVSTISLVATFLVTSGFVCGGANVDPHMGEMSGMADMADMADVDTGNVPGTPPASCDFPWAPDACLSMAPCAPVAIVAQHVVLPDVSSPRLYVSSTLVLQPPSETLAPELPPPRA